MKHELTYPWVNVHPGKRIPPGQRGGRHDITMAAVCHAYTKQGDLCGRRSIISRDGLCFCGMHWRMYAEVFQYHGGDAIAMVREDIARKRRRGDMRREEYQRQRVMVDGIVNDAIARALRIVDNDIRDPDPRPRPAVPAIPAPPPEPLARFVQDKQNVHTITAIQQTTDIIKRVMKIEVPKIFKWNMRRCSKTPGEIIADCRLSIQASRTMLEKYTSDDCIYSLGPGIYGRLLDSVWQYIKNSEDRKTLRTILKSELEDNVGMCQQGNLSRLANVLAGYLEGVGSFESISEVLGREFPKLLDIDNEDERIAQGNKILDRLAVMDADTRKVWIDGLY